jgi:hypothetical protein
MRVPGYLKKRCKLSQGFHRAAGRSGRSGPFGDRVRVFAGLLLGSLLLGACAVLSGSRSQPADAPVLSSHETPFLPPTLAPAAPAPVAQAKSPAKAQPTQAQVCSDNLTYVSDLTIKDGTVITPGAQLDKRWKVENSGSCNWNQHYRMKLIAGAEMGVPPEQSLYPARSGSQAVIRIVFTAPAAPGNYRSAWQAYNPKGDPFGDPFFIDVVVAAPTVAP